MSKINVFAQGKDSRPFLVVTAISLATDPEAPISITPEAPNNIVSFKSGDTLKVDVEIRSPQGDLLPINKTFALPLSGQLGSSPRILDIEFVGGAASVTIGGWVSGRWRVSEQEVNLDIPDPAQHFNFDGLTFKVRE